MTVCAEVVREQPDRAAHATAPSDVPDEETRDGISPDAGHPAERRAHDRNEAAEEDRLRAVIVEEVLRAVEALLGDPLEPSPSASSTSRPPAPADHVAEERAE